MKVFVAHSSNFDFKNKLYKPIRESALNRQHQFFLPQETGDEDVTFETIKNSDMLVCEVSEPSTGAGIELGWAHASKIPILCIYEKGSRPQASAEYVASEYVEYVDASDMLEKIEKFIQKISAQ